MELLSAAYVQRTVYFCQLLNPLHLLKSNQDIRAAADKPGSQRTANEVFLVASSVHPDTGDIIPVPLRMAAIVPMNIPIIAGLLLSRPTLPNIVFWQLVNQSYNFAVNHANANHSQETQASLGDGAADGLGALAGAYVAAVTASVAAAVGLERAAARLHSPVLSKAAPVLAVTLAGALNVLLVRRRELHTGIAVYDSPETGFACSDQPPGSRPEIGHGAHMALVDKHSIEAAKAALTQVVLTRVATSLGVLVLPQLLLALKGGSVGPVGRLAMIAASLQVALPLSLALYPQWASLRLPGRNRPVFYNKGL